MVIQISRATTGSRFGTNRPRHAKTARSRLHIGHEAVELLGCPSHIYIVNIGHVVCSAQQQYSRQLGETGLLRMVLAVTRAEYRTYIEAVAVVRVFTRRN